MDLKERKWRLPSQGANARRNEIFVAVRADSIQLNGNFMSQAQEKARAVFTHVFLMVDDENFCLRLELLTAKDYELKHSSRSFFGGLFELLQDGGNPAKRHNKSKLFVCRAFINSTPWLKAIGREKDLNKRRFPPMPTEEKNVFLVECIPSFVEKQRIDSVNIPRNVKGIYQYSTDAGEILYIGQGCLYDRYYAHQSGKQINADFFEYTIIEDEAARFRAEHHHLNVHYNKYKRLPQFNRIAGRKA